MDIVDPEDTYAIPHVWVYIDSEIHRKSRMKDGSWGLGKEANGGTFV